ncbi:putative sensor domain DACNV-containing protein [Mucilaginibacter sp. PAMB04274]|uniref:putative sensor domain DACNV-containing protein n=1 Tax=Mucilaginibacter sp. PAMB04274 TaxID=3138568 RepID=UPI0031F6EEDC
MFSEPSYLAARMVAETIEVHFAEHLSQAHELGEQDLATACSANIIEAVIDTAFWASLRREEGRSVSISMALLKPEQAGKPLVFGDRLRLTPHNLVKLAPAVEQPGIHLGVWHENDELYIWGTTHTVPGICFVLEVVEPGLLVIKHRRLAGFGKFVNIAVLHGDQIKVLDEKSMGIADCPALHASLMNMSLPSFMGEKFNVLVQLASSIRIHRRGGLVLIVPRASTGWQESIVHPIKYAVTPPYTVIADLMLQKEQERNKFEWKEALLQAIDIIGGFTAVDGATVITQHYDLLAFGAKVARSANSVPVEEIILTEPIAGAQATRIHPAQNGGTRHLAAAQFVHDQHDAVALVASQDGQFTVFAWSEKLKMVHAHRIDVLLL